MCRVQYRRYRIQGGMTSLHRLNQSGPSLGQLHRLSIVRLLGIEVSGGAIDECVLAQSGPFRTRRAREYRDSRATDGCRIPMKREQLFEPKGK